MMNMTLLILAFVMAVVCLLSTDVEALKVRKPSSRSMKRVVRQQLPLAWSWRVGQLGVFVFRGSSVTDHFCLQSKTTGLGWFSLLDGSLTHHGRIVEIYFMVGHELEINMYNLFHTELTVHNTRFNIGQLNL